LLEYCGYSASVAPTARDALAGPTPAIVVTELCLPDMDGYDLVRRLRERAGGRPMFVVAVSSRQPDDRRPAAGAGVDLYLSKPADPRELLAALARFSTGAASRG
jgi:DNA-binding response OmpR family regulator